ncbi:hypothetical protein NIES267_21970 [Calothrix parasitica NIES-267]|uniref:Knr4/Smi1-like domain-containing protein n=1 Tax=Calothrix parasitica NIES-267 TaxID=1973488 RepID=A0A1Z4LNC3_9CYAN|nr:hypothetical protein NIES267_21970 [Calothrix parasitica NIES-267]
MAINWQRIEPWIKPYSKIKNPWKDKRLQNPEDTALFQNLMVTKNKGLSNQEIAVYKKGFKVDFPEDFKEFHRKFRQDVYWHIGCWIILPFGETIRVTNAMGEIMVRDIVDDDSEYYWNSQWLVFAEHIKKDDVMCLNLDYETDLESENSIFSRLDEVFKFEYEDESGYVCPMKMGFGRWLEKWAIKLEKR